LKNSSVLVKLEAKRSAKGFAEEHQRGKMEKTQKDTGKEVELEKT